ncbi:MAG: branched-chain amino acid ABC transporter permease [Dethiobacter sp.]|nr:branched-chain amino acid ABC transporter permease [Dethiobacter sp.]
MSLGQIILQTFVNGVMSSMVLILIASGLCLIFGIMRVVNFAHGEFYMLGGFGAWLLFGQQLLPIESSVLRYVVAVMITMMVVALMGILVERYLFRPFRGDIRATIIVGTGVMYILQATTLVGFGIRDKAFGSPFSGAVRISGVSISQERLAVVIFGAIFTTIMYFFIQKTKLGLSMRAVAQDEEAASLQGINISKTFSLAMGIGIAMAAAGGALMAPIYYVNPYMGVEPIMKAFVVIILGGMGSLPGTVIGGFIVGFIESFASTFISPHVALMIVFLLLIVVLIVRPGGIFGRE